MFNKLTLLVTVALLLLADATPLPESGIAIPIDRRAWHLTLENGVFDHDKAIMATILLQNKHRQNLINMKNNLGPDAFPEDLQILPLAQLPPNVNIELDRRFSEPLTDEENDIEWAGQISIGTPGSNFLIDFDTGSSDLWVPSVSLPPSIKKHKYNPKTSRTSQLKKGTFMIQYGDKSSVSGPVYTDTVNVAGAKVKGQYFSPVTTLSSKFVGKPYDGVLGLAFPAISSLHQSPFFNTAISQHSVKTPSFGFKLAKKGSELFLGGANSKLYKGAIESHKLSSSNGFWQIGKASIAVNGHTVLSGFETIIDSGTTVMYGPPSAVKKLYASIPGSAVFDSTHGLYSFPCKAVPTVSFMWGGKHWSISSSNFNLGLTGVGSNRCVGAIFGQDFGLGKNVWLLGDSFMKNVYSVFNVGSKTVGFATLA